MHKTNRNHRFDLPRLELRCMKALWALEKATVHEIRAQLLPDRPLAYTTVMTVMGRLAVKGFARREKRGRAHLYFPTVSEETVREHALNQIVADFFRGSKADLRRHLGNSVEMAKEAASSGSPRAVPTSSAPSHASPANPAETEIDTSLL